MPKERLYVHEYDKRGNHRVIAPTETLGGVPSAKAGEWAQYTSPAMVEVLGVQYVFFTDYYSGMFLSDVIYRFEVFVAESTVRLPITGVEKLR